MIAGGILLTGLAGVSAASAQQSAFDIQNSSAQPLSSIHVSPDYSNWWGANLLRGRIPPGGKGTIPVPRATRSGECHYDIQIQSVGGRVTEYRGVDLCRTRRMNHR